MRLLDRMILSNIPVSWSTIAQGWKGAGNYARLLTLDEIAAYATDRLGKGSDSKDEAFLAGVGDSDEDKVAGVVERLARLEDSDGGLEKRKWRLVMLQSVMEELGQDPLYGSLALVEFWSSWGLPPDSALGKASEISAEDFSEQGFELLKESHAKWIRDEFARLSTKE